MRKKAWLRGQAKPRDWSQKQWQRRTSREHDGGQLKELAKCAQLDFKTARTGPVTAVFFFFHPFLSELKYLLLLCYPLVTFVCSLYVYLKGCVIHLFSSQILPSKETHTWVATPENLTQGASCLPRFYLVNTILDFGLMSNWMRSGGTGWVHYLCEKECKLFFPTEWSGKWLQIPCYLSHWVVNFHSFFTWI